MNHTLQETKANTDYLVENQSKVHTLLRNDDVSLFAMPETLTISEDIPVSKEEILKKH